MDEVDRIKVENKNAHRIHPNKKSSTKASVPRAAPMVSSLKKRRNKSDSKLSGYESSDSEGTKAIN